MLIYPYIAGIYDDNIGMHHY